MTSTDLVHSTHQVAYELPFSPAEEALTKAMSVGAAATGSMNFIWERPINDLWPDA